MVELLIAYSAPRVPTTGSESQSIDLPMVPKDSDMVQSFVPHSFPGSFRFGWGGGGGLASEITDCERRETKPSD
jgi:hypothetical protein